MLFNQLFKRFRAYKSTVYRPSSLPILDYRGSRILPFLGEIHIEKITAKDIRGFAKNSNMSPQGTNNAVRLINKILNYAVNEDLLENNVCPNYRIPVVDEVKHQKFIFDDDDLKEFLYNVENTVFRTERVTHYKQCIHLIMHTLSRAREIINLTAEEIDYRKKIIVIPASRMKTKRDHVIPLSSIVMDILDTLPKEGRIFPEESHRTISHCVEVWGDKKTSIHGFRSTGATILNRAKFSKDVIEMALSHKCQNVVRRSYNRYDYLDERREMLEWYSNYLLDLSPPQQTSIF